MLIVADPTIAEAAASEAPSELREVVEDLARAHRRADHLVVATRRTAQALSEAPWLSRDAKATWLHIRDKGHEVEARKASVVRWLEVVAHDLAPERSGGRFKVGFRWLHSANWSGRTRLLMEAHHDLEFAGYLCEVLLRAERSLGAGWEPCIAGGGNAMHCVALLQADRRPFLCILDHDTGAQSFTAGNATDRYRPDHVDEIYVLNARELENLLPPSLVVLAAEQVGDRALVDRVEQGRALLGEDGHRDCDLKAEVWRDMLPRAIELLRQQSGQKRAEALSDMGPRLRELGQLILAWSAVPTSRHKL